MKMEIVNTENLKKEVEKEVTPAEKEVQEIKKLCRNFSKIIRR